MYVLPFDASRCVTFLPSHPLLISIDIDVDLLTRDHIPHRTVLMSLLPSSLYALEDFVPKNVNQFRAIATLRHPMSAFTDFVLWSPTQE